MPHSSNHKQNNEYARLDDSMPMKTFKNKTFFTLLILFIGLFWTLTPSHSRVSGLPVNESSSTAYLPIVFKPLPPPPPPIGPPYDIARFMTESETFGSLYEVQHSGGSQARHQTQTENTADFFHTKGNEISAEWEELWYTDQYIYRGTDTSPGDGKYYTLRENNQYGSKWAPRYWNVGDIFQRSPNVTFYSKDNCSPLFGGVHTTWLKFEAFHESYTFTSGITLGNVIQLAWLLDPNAAPTERYFYAEGYGLVAWESTEGYGSSYISEIHDPGQRPNNTREVISCLNLIGWLLDGIKNLPPIPPEYLRLVK